MADWSEKRISGAVLSVALPLAAALTSGPAAAGVFGVPGDGTFEKPVPAGGYDAFRLDPKADHSVTLTFAVESGGSVDIFVFDTVPFLQYAGGSSYVAIHQDRSADGGRSFQREVAKGREIIFVVVDNTDTYGTRAVGNVTYKASFDDIDHTFELAVISVSGIIALGVAVVLVVRRAGKNRRRRQSADLVAGTAPPASLRAGAAPSLFGVRGGTGGNTNRATPVACPQCSGTVSAGAPYCLACGTNLRW